MIYVWCAKHRAHDLVRGIWHITRPPHVRPEWEPEQEYCEVVDHPTLPFSILCMPEEDSIPLHLEADTSLLEDVLDEFVSDGALTQEELDGILSAVQSMAGERVKVVDLIPPSWQANVMHTKEEAIAAGFYPAEETE